MLGHTADDDFAGLKFTKIHFHLHNETHNETYIIYTQ